MGIGWVKEGSEGKIISIVYCILVYYIYMHHVI